MTDNGGGEQARIAFVVTEYPTETPDTGGLATYVQRMARALRSAGHAPEVFVSTENESGTIDDDGVAVHRVNWISQYPKLSRIYRLTRNVMPLSVRDPAMWAMRASALAVAFHRRDRETSFDLVQSSDYQVPGLFIANRDGCNHVVRCSSAIDLYGACDGTRSWGLKVQGVLERRIMRKAHAVYAPSKFLADHFATVHGIHVGVIRPPKYRERPPVGELGFRLPDRFFLHYGQLRERKGTELLAQALVRAWKDAPDLEMVWIGEYGTREKWQRWCRLWGAHAGKVHATGPLPRDQLYAVLQRAAAAVLPSLVDNLPNTVIESLMFGIPVLGSRGASIDELVEENITGHLATTGDAEALASAMVRMWQGRSPVKKGFSWRSPIAMEMSPERAVASLLAFGGVFKDAGRADEQLCTPHFEPTAEGAAG